MTTTAHLGLRLLRGRLQGEEGSGTLVIHKNGPPIERQGEPAHRTEHMTRDKEGSAPVL